MRPAYRRRTCIGYGPRSINTEWRREFPRVTRPGGSRTCIYDGHRRRYNTEPRYIQDVPVHRRPDPPCLQDSRLLCEARSNWLSCPYTQGDEITAQAEVPIGINLSNMHGQKDLHLTLNLKLVPECQVEDEASTKLEKSNGNFLGFLPCFNKDKNKASVCKPDMGMILKEMCGNLLAINDAIKKMKMDQDNFIIRREEQSQLFYDNSCNHAYMRKRGGRDDPPNNGRTAPKPSGAKPPNADNYHMRRKDEDKDSDGRGNENNGRDRDHVVDDMECSIDDNKTVCDKKRSSSYKEKPTVKNKTSSYENNKPTVEKKRSSKEKRPSVHNKRSSYENNKPIVDSKRSSKEHNHNHVIITQSEEEILVADKNGPGIGFGKPSIDKKRSSNYEKKPDLNIKESKPKKRDRNESKTSIDKQKKTQNGDKNQVKKVNASDDEIILKKLVEPSCSYEIPKKLSMHGSERALKVLTTSSTTFNPVMSPSQHKIQKLLSILTERPSFTLVEKMSDDYILGKSKDPGQNKFNPYRKYYCDEDRFVEALGFKDNPDWSVTYRKPEPRLDRTSSENMNVQAHRSRSKSSKSSGASRASDKSNDIIRLERPVKKHTKRYKPANVVQPPVIRKSMRQVIDPRPWNESAHKKAKPPKLALFDDSDTSGTDLMLHTRRTGDKKKERRRKNRVMTTYRMEDDFYTTRSYAVDLLRRIEDTLEDDCF